MHQDQVVIKFNKVELDQLFLVINKVQHPMDIPMLNMVGQGLIFLHPYLQQEVLQEDQEVLAITLAIWWPPIPIAIRG